MYWYSAYQLMVWKSILIILNENNVITIIIFLLRKKYAVCLDQNNNAKHCMPAYNLSTWVFVVHAI